MIFLELQFEERVRRIADLGFEVEIWNWATKDLDALARTGATFSSLTGYLAGTLTDPAGADELLRTAQLSLAAAERLDCPRLNVHGTGLDGSGLPVVPVTEVTPAMWLTAARTLERLAAAGELVAYRHHGFWECMDTYKDNLQLNELWDSGRAAWAVWERA
jgi:hydroxypyruvate isomerase